MSEDLPEPQKSEEFQTFEKLVKTAFTTPKAEIDAADREASKKARKRIPAKSNTPPK